MKNGVFINQKRTKNPEMPFQKLIDGYTAFHKSYFEENPALYTALADSGQNPEALVIACSDSRIDPAIVTTSQPGDLFVVRNVAAIVPPYENDSRRHGTSAAIEFAVKVLKIKHIIVMGHALCGGIQALANKEDTNEIFDFIGPWMSVGSTALEAVEKSLHDADPQVRQKALEQAVILLSLNNLMSFPWVREKATQGSLALHGWYFDLKRGVLEEYDPATSSFQAIQTIDTRHDSCECHNFSMDALLRHYRKTGQAA